MAFQPDELQLRILLALEQLELHGCSSATELGEECLPRITLGIGVPDVILCAWSGADGEVFRNAIPPLERRGLVKRTTRKGWPLFGSACRIRTPDGRVIWLQWARVTGKESCEYFAGLLGAEIRRERTTKRPKARRSRTQPSSPAFIVEAWVGKQRGTILNDAKVIPQWYGDGAIPYCSISKCGLACLDDASSGLDDLVNLSQVAPLTGRSERTLQRYIRTGTLPKPDFPGGGGKPNKWYWRNLRPALEKAFGRTMPARFPGSRII